MSPGFRFGAEYCALALSYRWHRHPNLCNSRILSGSMHCLRLRGQGAEGDHGIHVKLPQIALNGTHLRPTSLMRSVNFQWALVHICFNNAAAGQPHRPTGEVLPAAEGDLDPLN